VTARRTTSGMFGGGYLFSMEGTVDTLTTKRNFKLYGEAHPNARLTRAQVLEIREEAGVDVLVGVAPVGLPYWVG
jgi:hypothetical protein